MQITAAQCRAARSLLNWTQEELATNARVARATVADFEANARQPMKNNIIAMADCMYAAGIEFLPEEGQSGVGVRYRSVRIEYVKNITVDQFHRVIKIPMKYAGEKFICSVSYNAVDDYFGSNFSSDQEYGRAVEDMLPRILVLAEQLAPTRIHDGKLLLSTELVN
jgi:transcriptional regulator with XRE-family HTH domain